MHNSRKKGQLNKSSSCLLNDRSQSHIQPARKGYLVISSSVEGVGEGRSGSGTMGRRSPGGFFGFTLEEVFQSQTNTQKDIIQRESLG